jgi:hypothetical protein
MRNVRWKLYNPDWAGIRRRFRLTPAKTKQDGERDPVLSV